MTQGLYIRSLVNTTINGTILNFLSGNNESTAINQQIMFEQYNGTASCYIVMKSLSNSTNPSIGVGSAATYFVSYNNTQVYSAIIPGSATMSVTSTS